MGNGTTIGGMSAVPLTSGGTGATSASGALANLGGQQTISVTAYGAAGDCAASGSVASCTDNTAAIQAAINSAYVSGGSVYLPINPSTANSTTVYYVASTLNPKGVSIYGPHGAGGFFANVIIRGAAGKDVFAPGDPSSGGYVTPHSSYVWQDFGIVVDDSVDVSANFPIGAQAAFVPTLWQRMEAPRLLQLRAIRGRTIWGKISLFQTGRTRLRRLLHPWGKAQDMDRIQRHWHKTWNYPTHNSSILYVSIMGLPTTATVGNCGLAYDDTANNTNGSGPNQAVFRNLAIRTTSESMQNNSCGFLFQGVAGQPYADIFENLHIRTMWGFLAIESDTSGSGINGALGDLNEIRNVIFDTFYPWVSYDGGWTRWYGGQIDGAQFGPQCWSTTRFRNPMRDGGLLTAWSWRTRAERQLEEAGALRGWITKSAIRRLVEERFYPRRNGTQ